MTGKGKTRSSEKIEKSQKSDPQRTYEYSKEIINVIHEPLIVLNTDLKVITANNAFYKTFKVNPAETKNRPIYKLGNGQWNIPELKKLLEDILPKKKAFNNFEVEHEFPTIGIKTMLLNARQLDHLSMILLAIEDITEQKKDRGDIKMTREYGESLVETIREPLIVLNTDLKVITANNAFYKTFKVNPAETKNRPIYKLGNGQWNIPELKKLLEDILPKKKAFNNFEVEHEFPTIGIKTMLLNARQLDHLSMILLAIEDITKIKHVERGLEKSEGKLKTLGLLFTSSRDAIMTLAPPSWKFNSGNPATIKMFNLKDEKELASLGPVDLSPEKQPDGQLSSIKAKKMIEKAIQEGSNFFEWTHRRHNGDNFPASVLLSKFEEEGKYYLQATVRDVSEQKKNEEDLKKNEEKIKAQIEQLKELDIAKTDFMNIISHELKTPLTAIYANLELLEEIKDKLPEQNINNLNALRRNSNQLRFLVDNILEIARIQSNKFELNISEIDLEDCIKSVETDLKILAERKNLELIIEIEKPIKIDTDRIRLTEILVNLIDNAIKYTDKGHVRVRAKKQNGAILVEIIDTGMGIAKDKKPKLFQKFYQISTSSKSEVGGTGLGLSITKQLVELLGGQIKFKSELGKGSTFYFTLPIKHKPALQKPGLFDNQDKASQHKKVVLTVLAKALAAKAREAHKTLEHNEEIKK